MQHMKCIFLYCFYPHLTLERAIYVLMLIYSYLFGLHMCFIGCGGSHMAWPMISFAPLVGISLIWSKFILYSMYTSVSPQKYVFNIMNLVGIASHITFTFLSDYSINFHVYMFLSVYI